MFFLIYEICSISGERWDSKFHTQFKRFTTMSEDTTIPSSKTIRLKCFYNNEIRVVRLRDGISFTDLKERLNEDYGFDVLMRYEDTDGDLITLETQNDLNELLESELKSVQVQISNLLDGGGGSSPTNSSPRNSRSFRSRSSLTVVSEQSKAPSPTNSTQSSQPRPSSRISVRPISSSSNTRPISRSLQGYGMRLVTSRRSSNRFASHDLGSEASSVVADATRNKISWKWQRGEILGKGAFGTVYLGLNLQTGELMAVKQLNTNEVSQKELATLEHEIEILTGLVHPNIVQYLGTERESDKLSIFLEFVPGGSIRNLLEKFGTLEEKIIRVYCRQLLLGLEYLHRNGIAHRDIKGANVLLSTDGVIKLADLYVVSLSVSF